MDIREIEKIVDTHHHGSSYFNKVFAQAIFDLLRTFENESQLSDVANSMRGAAPTFDGIKRDLMDALNIGLKWVFEYYSRNSNDSDVNNINFDYSEDDFFRTDEFLRSYCLPYSKICDAYAAYSRKRFDVKIEGNDVFFKATETQIKAITAEMGEFFDKRDIVENGFAVKASAIILANEDALRDTLKTVHYENGRICYTNTANHVFLQLADELWKDSSILPSDWAFNDFTLEEFRLCWRELYALSFMHTHVCSSGGIRGLAVEDCVIVQESNIIKNYLIERTSLRDDVVDAVLKLLVFDPRLKHADIMYQPAVAIGNKFLIAPSLFVNGTPERNLIALIQMKNRDKKHFEEVNNLESLMRNQIESDIVDKSDIILCHDLKIEKDGKLITDVDFGIYDLESQSVLICEMKWLLEADATWEVYAREDDVDHGCEQINTAMGFAMCHSAEFMKKAFNVDISDNIEFFCCVITKTNVRNNSKTVPVISQRKFMEILKKKASYRDMFETIRREEYKTPLAKGVEQKDYEVQYAGFRFHIPALIIPNEANLIS